HSPRASQYQVDCPLERIVNPVGHDGKSQRLDPDYPAGFIDNIHADGLCLITESSIFRVFSSPGSSFSGIEFGPSQSAVSGSSCTSMKIPSIPVATAARDRYSTNSRWPPELSPWPPGSCTLWVASNTT